MSEKPFKVDIPDSEIDALKVRLKLTRLPDELDGAGWDYGMPLADVRRLIERWTGGYDWRKAERAMNELAMFTRDVDVDGFGTLNIHYVHQKSAVKNAIPLLFVHGWPGSFLEVQKILPLLNEASSEHPSFHVVAISLPGFTFSENPRKKGFKVKQYAEVANKLMLALGYDKYVSQGGDWGHILTRAIAGFYGGKHVKAWHSNMAQAFSPRLSDHPVAWLRNLITPYAEWERKGLKRSEWFDTRGKGYFWEQSTQPQTLGYALADSPVGLLAWIYEKLVTWSDSFPWDDDEVLTWVSLYWFSRAGPAASLPIYCEVGLMRDSYKPLESTLSKVPMGMSWFAKDIFVNPKRTSCVHDGGHFASYERPKELVNDVRAMFGKDGPAHGVVPGKTGFD